MGKEGRKGQKLLPLCPITIGAVILFQYVWSSVMDILGWLNGVIIRKLNVRDPITSSVLAAIIGMVESPFKLIRLDPRLGLREESNATPRPTT
jgi:hypothetical protein